MMRSQESRLWTERWRVRSRTMLSCRMVCTCPEDVLCSEGLNVLVCGLHRPVLVCGLDRPVLLWGLHRPVLLCVASTDQFCCVASTDRFCCVASTDQFCCVASTHQIWTAAAVGIVLLWIFLWGRMSGLLWIALEAEWVDSCGFPWRQNGCWVTVPPVGSFFLTEEDKLSDAQECDELLLHPFYSAVWYYENRSLSPPLNLAVVSDLCSVESILITLTYFLPIKRKQMRLHIVNVTVSVKDYIYYLNVHRCSVQIKSLESNSDISRKMTSCIFWFQWVNKIVDYRLFCFVCCYFCVDDAPKCPNHEAMQLRQNTVIEFTCILIWQKDSVVQTLMCTRWVSCYVAMGNHFRVGPSTFRSKSSSCWCVCEDRSIVLVMWYYSFAEFGALNTLRTQNIGRRRSFERSAKNVSFREKGPSFLTVHRYQRHFAFLWRGKLI